MNFDFRDTFPRELNLEPILISGSDSMKFTKHTYLIAKSIGIKPVLYEIRYEIHCSPFKQAMIIDDLLAVGYEEYFYLFNLTINTNTLKLKMGGYFGHLYYDPDLFYITDAGGLYCIDKNGSVRWQNNSLAIDGVIIENFTEDKIIGSGEWDPPGGWRNFILNKITGSTVK
jgi:hypothetical protein